MNPGRRKKMAKSKIQDCTKNGEYAKDSHDRVIIRVDSTTLIIPRKKKVKSKGAEKVVEEWRASVERGRKVIY